MAAVDPSLPPGAPMGHPLPVEVPADRIAKAHELAARISAATPDERRKLVVSPDLASTLVDGATVNIEPLAPLGSGLIGTVVVLDANKEVRERWTQVYVGPHEQPSDPWVVRQWPPLAAHQRVHARSLAIRAWIDVVAGAIDVDAMLEVDTAGETTIPLTLTFAHDVEVTQDDVPCPTTVLDRELVIAPRHPGPHARLHLRYRWIPGTVGSLDHNSKVTRDAVLAGGHDPFTPYASGAFDVTLDVVHPASLELVSSMSHDATRDLAPGWKESRYRARGAGLTIAGDTAWRHTRLAGPPPVSIALLPGSEDRRPWLRGLFTRIVAADECLGPIPSGEISLVEIERGEKAYNAGGIIVLPATWAMRDDVIAHEVAHFWFGSHYDDLTVVKATEAAEHEVEWYEAMAEYVATWSLDPDAALRRRLEWIERYDVNPALDVPLTGYAADLPHDVWADLRYAKAPLVLAALEARVGRPAMQEAIGALVKTYAGREISWQEIADLFAARFGERTGAWFRAWLQRGPGPTLWLEDVQRDGGSITGVIRQDLPIIDEVELATWQSLDENRTIRDLGRRVRVKVAGERTRFRIDVTSDARSVAVDPLAYVPREWPGTDVSTEVPLSDAGTRP
jgi:hypothetical protein